MPSRKGKPNKNKKFLLNRLQDMYGEEFHPIMKMAENADRLQNLLDTVPEEDINVLFVGLKNTIDSWDKIAQYTEPKLKAVDHSGQVDTTINVTTVDYSKEH